MLLYRLAPVSLKKAYRLRKATAATLGRDGQRLLRYGFAYVLDEDNLRARLRMLIHFIEKGLNLPDPRPCFGLARLQQMADVVGCLGKDNAGLFEMRYAARLLVDYQSFHAQRGIVLPASHNSIIHAMQEVVGIPVDSGQSCCCKVDREDFFNVPKGFFSAMALTRHSVRNYRPEAVPRDVIREIARVAATAPSACNRQPCHIYAIDDKPLVDEVLSLTRGSGGFGHLAPLVLVITSDLKCRDDVSERHQVGIDAGFFGMNLLYALHEQRIGACILNWDDLAEADSKLRALLPAIKDSETVLYLVTCGYTPEMFNVPPGLRRSDNLTFIG